METSNVQRIHRVATFWISGEDDGIKKAVRCPWCGHRIFDTFQSANKVEIMFSRGEMSKPKETFCKGSIKLEREDGQVDYIKCKTIIRIE